MWLLLRSAIAQPQLQDDQALVLRETKAKTASFRGAASKSGNASPTLSSNRDSQGSGPPSDSPRMLV